MSPTGIIALAILGVGGVVGLLRWKRRRRMTPIDPEVFRTLRERMDRSR